MTSPGDCYSRGILDMLVSSALTLSRLPVIHLLFFCWKSERMHPLGMLKRKNAFSSDILFMLLHISWTNRTNGDFQSTKNVTPPNEIRTGKASNTLPDHLKTVTSGQRITHKLYNNM